MSTPRLAAALLCPLLLAAAAAAGAEPATPPGTWFDWVYATWPAHAARLENASFFEDTGSLARPKNPAAEPEGRCVGEVVVSGETQWARTVSTGADPAAEEPESVVHLAAEAPSLALDALWLDGQIESVVGGFETDRQRRATLLGRARVGNFLCGNVPGTWVRGIPGPEGEGSGFEPDPAAVARLRETGACTMPTPWGPLTCTDTRDTEPVRRIRIGFSAGPGDLSPFDGQRLPAAMEAADGVTWTREAEEAAYVIDGWGEVGGVAVPVSGSFDRTTTWAGAGTERMTDTIRRTDLRPIAPGEAAAGLRAQLEAIPRGTRVQDLADPGRALRWEGAEAAGF